MSLDPITFGMMMALSQMGSDPLTEQPHHSQRKTRNAMHEGSKRFHAVLTELGELHDKKQQDYGTDEDPFANVRGSTEWGVPAWQGAMIRASDKVRRLQAYARNGELANEGAEDAFKDLAVYAIIALVLWEEEHVIRAFHPDLEHDLKSELEG